MLRYSYWFGFLILSFCLIGGFGTGCDSTVQTNPAHSRGDSLLSVNVFKIGQKEKQVASPAEWLKLQKVISNRLNQTSEKDKERNEFWVPSALYDLRNRNKKLTEPAEVTLKIQWRDGQTEALKTMFLCDSGPIKIQPNFGDNHVRSIHQLQLGRTYKLNRVKAGDVLRIKPLRYWLVPDNGQTDIAVEYLVMNGPKVLEGRHQVDYITFWGLLPYENGVWNDAAYLERTS